MSDIIKCPKCDKVLSGFDMELYDRTDVSEEWD